MHATSSQQLYIHASNEQEYNLYLGVLNDGGNQWTLCPNADHMLRLGLPNHRWGQIYSNSASINTSDRNEKENIVLLNNNIKDFIMDLKPVSFKYKDGESGRTHHGFIAQDVEDTLNKLNMTPMDFAGFCKDQKTETYEEEVVDTINDIDDEGNVVTRTSTHIERKDRPITGQYLYGLRYEEFIPALTKVVQMQDKEITNLKTELASIKNRLNNQGE